jgi:hypothetical protein
MSSDLPVRVASTSALHAGLSECPGMQHRLSRSHTYKSNVLLRTSPLSLICTYHSEYVWLLRNCSTRYRR